MAGYGQGLGTGLPNDFDYTDIELRALEFLAGDTWRIDYDQEAR